MSRQTGEKPATQSTALRACNVLKALRGSTLIGKSNKQLAQELGVTPSAITLSLNTLVETGFVRKLEETDRYAHSIAFLQIAEAHRQCIEKMQNRTQEINARVIAGANHY